MRVAEGYRAFNVEPGGMYTKAFILIGVISLMTLPAIASSTTADGDFQAIAQSPNRIELYLRHNGHTSRVYMNGKPAASFAPDPKQSFARLTIDNLTPNTLYTFSMGKTGPTVSEKTPCELSDQSNYDVLIIGGTASGVAAAVTAARLGLTVALVEETNRLGGMSSNGLGSTDIRNVSRSNGIFEDFRQKVKDFYGSGNGLRYEPRVANAIFKSMVYEHDNISVFLRSRYVRPITDGNCVLGAIICNEATGRSGKILAHVTIDATDTADFAADAGAKFVYGREARSPEEPHAGHIYFDDASQEILPGSTGCADCRQQSYAYLMIWKDYGEPGAPIIDKPDHYDPESFHYSSDWADSWNYTSGKLPNGKFEINQHPFGIDWPGINNDYPTADRTRRNEIADMYKARALGYLYYMQTVRGHTNLGLADDEFLDNGNFPVSMYVREARRIVGDYTFKECDVTCAPDTYRTDTAGIGDYPMDSHAVEELTDPTRKDKGEGELWLATFTPWYQFPYGVMVPEGIEGLLVSTAISATHIGYGTLRMEPVRMSLGQAAGAAAYWSILYGRSLHRINPAWIQDKVLSQHAYVSWNSDVNAGTRHFKAINFLGARGIFRGDEFRPDDPLTNQEAVDSLNRMITLEGCNQSLPTGNFAPSHKITRGEFASWLVQAKQMTSKWWNLVEPECSSYSDLPKDSPYYASVETLKRHRIDASLFSDTPPGTFKPDDPITRADAAEAIYLAHRTFAMSGWK